MNGSWYRCIFIEIFDGGDNGCMWCSDKSDIYEGIYEEVNHSSQINMIMQVMWVCCEIAPKPFEDEEMILFFW